MSIPRGFIYSCLVPIALAACLPGLSFAAEKPSYEDLLKRVKQYDRTVDFGALRLAYAETQEYAPYGGNDGSEKMFTALRDKNFPEALAAAQKILDKNYVDIDAHTVCKIAYRQTREKEKADYHAFVAGGLIDSILASGKLAEQEKAPVVIGVNEEYTLMRALGVQPKQQKLIGAGGHSYDRIEAVDPKTGQEIVIYFNVDIPMAWLDRQFKKPKKSEVGVPVRTSQAPAPAMSEGHPTPMLPPVPPPDARPVDYQCPKGKYIDCMPPIQGKAREMCAPEYLDWVRKNCPGVEVVH